VKIFKALWMISFLMSAALLSACQTAPPPPVQEKPQPSAELLERPYLFEIVRYLYQWQLDETEVNGAVGAKQFIFWVRGINVKLDPGDKSMFGQIILPQLGLSVNVKKADYTIDELKLAVKSNDFKITEVSRGIAPATPPSDCEVVQVDMKEMLDYLFRTRDQRDYADPALLQRMRGALREEVAKEGLSLSAAVGEQVVHLAPLSPVANETWIFWEAGRKLFYFSSDIDFSNPAVWQNEKLMVRVFDLDSQVVVSHEEAPGSNDFLTRYEVSRALFNCILLGQRIVVPGRYPTTAPAAAH
jgi:hypothetical protein